MAEAITAPLLTHLPSPSHPPTAVLVHCGVWPVQAERLGEGLRGRTPVVLRGTHSEYRFTRPRPNPSHWRDLSVTCLHPARPVQRAGVQAVRPGGGGGAALPGPDLPACLLCV